MMDSEGHFQAPASSERSGTPGRGREARKNMEDDSEKRNMAKKHDRPVEFHDLRAEKGEEDDLLLMLFG